MKEYIKMGFGFGIGYILGKGLAGSIAVILTDELKKSKKKDLSDSSTEEGEA